jgi:intracellular septation protein
MQALYDFFPIICFGIFYYFYGIYVATASAMVASFLQVLVYWIRHKRFEKIQTTTCILILVLGAATLIFHKTIFIKWKPSIIYWLFGCALAGSQIFKKKPLLQNLLDGKIKLAPVVWARLTWIWALFFLAMGFLNLWFAYMYSTEVWVYFKVIGTTGLTLIFVVAQAFYLAKHIQPEPETS